MSKLYTVILKNDSQKNDLSKSNLIRLLKREIKIYGLLYLCTKFWSTLVFELVYESRFFFGTSEDPLAPFRSSFIIRSFIIWNTEYKSVVRHKNLYMKTYEPCPSEEDNRSDYTSSSSPCQMSIVDCTHLHPHQLFLTQHTLKTFVSM